MRRLSLAAMIAVVGLAACDKKSLGLGGAETLEASDAKWNDSELTIGSANAKFFMTGSGDKDPLFMNTYFDKFPSRTEIDVAGTKGTTDERGYLAMDVDMKKKVGSLATREINNNAVDLGVKVIIKAPDSDTIEEKLPPMRVAGAIAAALVKARDGALKFEGEPADDGKVGSVAVVQAGGSTQLSFIGNPEKVWDLDWVAVEEQKDSGRTKSCSGYEKVKGAITVVQSDSTVKIYERRSGKLIQEKAFQPEDECPHFAFVSPDNKANAYVGKSQIETWVRGVFDAAKK